MGDGTTSDELPGGVATTNHADGFRDDPHPVYDLLRAHGPLVDDPAYGRALACDHDTVRAVLRDRRFGVDARRASHDSYVRRISGTGVSEGRGQDYEPPLVLLDDPAHRRIRLLVSRAFTARVVEAEAPRIRRVADELLDGLEGRRVVDLVTEVAEPLPARVIAELLGLEGADPADLARWSEDILWGYDPERDRDVQDRLRRAYRELTAAIRDVVADRRRRPADDLVSAMVRAQVHDDRLSDLEIVSLCVQLMVAGNVTTSDLVGNAVHALLTTGQWALLVEDPERVDAAVEEALRYDCPITETARIALEDAEAGGCPVHAGRTLTLSLSAANHDPARWSEPHRFDLRRDASGHLAFGSGDHVCLGAALARLEARTILRGLTARFPGASLADEAPQRRHLPFFRGFVRLPVRLG